MTKSRLLIPALGIVVVLTQAALVADIKVPAVADSRLDLTLVAADPDIMTPITQSKVSLMPEDLAGVLTLQDFRDLLAFLLSPR